MPVGTWRREAKDDMAAGARAGKESEKMEKMRMQQWLFKVTTCWGQDESVEEEKRRHAKWVFCR
ncbi:unnamed protein product, partial [Protopolystoma xenopodis]